MEKINLKIYGVTTVGPKGQIIIPKDCRSDFGIEVGSEFEIAMADKSAFGIGKTCEIDRGTKKGIKILEKLGNINIGTKYQFVIPSLIRNKLGIEAGDSLIVIGKANKGLGFIKNDKIEYLLEYIKEETI